MIEFDIKGASGVRKTTRIVGEGYNLCANSGVQPKPYPEQQKYPPF